MEPQEQPHIQYEPTSRTNPPQTNPYLVPLAIIVAGALIASALFFSHTASPNISAASQKAQVSGTQTQGSIENVLPVTASDHILGSPDTPIVLVEYSDLECPFCKQFQTTMQQIMDTYGKNGQVSWVFRDFPLYQNLHPKAEKEAEASECVNQLGGNQDFWKFIDGIYAITPSNNGLDPAELPVVAKSSGVDVTQFNTCLSSGKYTNFVVQSYQNAIKADGQGTPYVVLILKNPLDQTAQQALIAAAQNAIQQSAGATLPDDFFTFSSDGTKVAWDGALPITVTEAILDTILKH